MKLQFTPSEICEVIRHVNSMSKENFINVFGVDQGTHFFRKLVTTYKMDIGKLLMNFDLGAQQRFFQYYRRWLDVQKE